MNRKAAGFTIIELIVVIALLGILSAVALPRFISVTDDAHTAAVSGAGAGFATGVALIRAQSIAEGTTGDAVEGFGDGTLWVNASGAPTSVGSVNLNCTQVWEGLLQANAPTVADETAPDGIDYEVSITGSECTYTYHTDTSDNGARTITYNANTRTVIVSAAGASL